MLIRTIREEEKDIYNQVVDHPLQSWEWGTFRARTGLPVERVGFFDNGQLKRALQVTFHPIPVLNRTAGYCPKSFMPDEEQLSALDQLGQRHNSLFIKIEPNVGQPVENASAFPKVKDFLADHHTYPGRPLFTRYTFQLDPRHDLEKLFGNLSNKTRYNVNLAYKKGVQVVENTSSEGMETYLQILSETTQRQGFYAHSPEYFRTMWEVLGKSGMMRIFEAQYQGQVLVSWIIFVFNNVIYYPYGASRSTNREVMASNLMMWEIIAFAHQQGYRLFDMWGSLGPNPDPKDPWFGFHRFKKGYGATLIEFLGTYDVVMDQPLYKVFRVAENLRWKFLRLKAKLR